MIIDDFGGATSVFEIGQLETALSRKFAGDVNEFWLSRASGRFPTMSIMMRGNLAALHYFPFKEHPGFISQGRASSNESGVTVFSSGSVNQKIEIADENVVEMAAAINAAKQFLFDSDLPDCINWFEL